ncbi:hypothetical protein NYO67_12321 [Aspergillus flavus]|nr:hypothetical protein NYO67_12321 [Aspergillus flavus]
MASDYTALYPRYSSYSGHDRSLPPTPSLKLTYERPLAANKVVELACIITANATGAALASMGAEVIQGLYYRAAFLFMADKITTDLILDNPSGYARLTQLFEEADAIIQGYHLGLFARQALLMWTKTVAARMVTVQGGSKLPMWQQEIGHIGIYILAGTESRRFFVARPKSC